MTRNPLAIGGVLVLLCNAPAAMAQSVAPPWSDLGGGLAGTAGVPALSGTGPLLGGSPGTLGLSGAQPASPSLLLVSLSSTPVPFKGGTLVAFPVAFLAALSTDGLGGFSLPFAWPAGVPAGTNLWFQCALQDAGAVHGVALSNALLAVAAGDPPGPPVAYALDFVATAATGIAMNDAGDVVGTSYLDTGCGPFCLPPQQTVAWHDGNRIVLPTLPGWTGITVKGMNADGWIVGQAGTYTTTRAVLWRPQGAGYAITDLGTLPGTTSSTAVGVDDLGRIVGWSTTVNFPPNGSPFLWTEAGGLVDLSALGYPDESPTAISRGGTVATYGKWYRLGDPGSVVTIAPAPGSYGIGGGATAINDAGDQGRFLITVCCQNLAYLYRYLHEGVWQQLSAVPTGQLTTYGIGSINDALDLTATVQSTGVIAYGPDGLAEGLASKISPAYPGSSVYITGPMNSGGTILSRVFVGNSARLVRLVPAWTCETSCLRVAGLWLTADFVPDPSDPSQDHCSPTLNAHNEALVTVLVTDADGAPLADAVVAGRFLDDYWTDAPVVGTTDAAGLVSFPYTGPCGVGAIAFLVDDVLKPGYVLDKLTGVLAASAIPH